MPQPAYFPQPYGPPVIRTYQSLEQWTGSGWRCASTEVCAAYWMNPEGINTYDARDVYPTRLRTVSPPYLLATLWYLSTDNRWYLHRRWTNRAGGASEYGWGGDLIYK